MQNTQLHTNFPTHTPSDSLNTLSESGGSVLIGKPLILRGSMRSGLDLATH